MESPNPSTHSPADKPSYVTSLAADDAGRIDGLQANTSYFVIRKPDLEKAKDPKAMLENFRSFIHEQRLVTEKQMQEFNEKYGTPVKAKAKDLRNTLEKRFDAIAKEVETRVGQLENEIETRAPQVSKVLKSRKADNVAESTTSVETPGEMPAGEDESDVNEGAAKSNKKKTRKNN